MQNIVQLKTQLSEAARLAKSNTLGHVRLAVILLDNFVEIQLADLLKMKLFWYNFDRKYSHERQKSILSHHETLLKACVDEQIITPSDQKLIAFCHVIRNHLYHQGSENELLAKVALSVLYTLIIKYQPDWKSARGLSFTADSHDPYMSKGADYFSVNDKEEWVYFLRRHFKVIDRREKRPSRLLSDYLVGKIRETNRFIEYIKYEFPIFFPRAKGWKFNDYLMNYSFFIVHNVEIENLNTIKDRNERRSKFEELQLDFEKKWRIKSANRLKDLLQSAEKIATLSLEKALEKYLTTHDEVILIYNSFYQAAADLDRAVDQEIDRRRGK